MKPFEYHPEAEAEYIGALRQYATRTGVEDAIALQTAVESAITRIRSVPGQFARYSDTEVRECILTRHRYVIYFEEVGEIIRILAFAHGHRREGYWLSRVADPEGTSSEA